MVPPCWVTMAWTMESPSPEPSALVVKKGSKIRSRASGGTPGPLSSMSDLDRARGSSARRGRRPGPSRPRGRRPGRSASGSPAPGGAAPRRRPPAGPASKSRMHPHVARSGSPAEQVEHPVQHRRHARPAGKNSRGRANWRKSSRMWSRRRISSFTRSSGSSSGPCSAAGSCCTRRSSTAELQRGGVERVADLVGEAGRHGADRGQLLGHLRLAAPARASRRGAGPGAWPAPPSRAAPAGCTGFDQVGAGAGPHRARRRLQGGEAGEEHHLAVRRRAP